MDWMLAMMSGGDSIWLYLVLVLPAVIFALWASFNVNSTYKKYSKVNSDCGWTGEVAARRILDSNGLHHVKIEHVSGNLTDHYDPKANVIRLSDAVYSNTSAAAIGVAAHEAGHAVQYAKKYAPIHLRAAIVPVCNIGSNLAMPLVIIGLLMGTGKGQGGIILANIGIILFALSALFQLITLPVEFNASRRALSALSDTNYMSDTDLKSAKKVLTAAALTYVAALAVALANLLRLILIVNGSRRDD